MQEPIGTVTTSGSFECMPLLNGDCEHCGNTASTSTDRGGDDDDNADGDDSGELWRWSSDDAEGADGESDEEYETCTEGGDDVDSLVDSDESDSDIDENTDDGSEDVAAEVANIMGSIREHRYQVALEDVQELIAEIKQIGVRLAFEPFNPMDVNAIICEAYLSKGWTNVGTIPRRKVTKVTKAMRERWYYYWLQVC